MSQSYQRVSVYFSYASGHYPRFIPTGDVPFDRTKGFLIVEDTPRTSLGPLVRDLYANGFVLESAHRQFQIDVFRLRFVFAHVSVAQRTERVESCEDLFLATIARLTAESFWNVHARITRQKISGRCDLKILCFKPLRRVSEEGKWLPGYSPESSNSESSATLRLEQVIGKPKLRLNRFTH